MSEENNQEIREEQAEAKTYTQDEVDELVGGLKHKVDELLGKRKKAADEAQKAKLEAEKAKEEAIKRNGDIEELKAFYEEKNKELEAAYADKLNKLNSAVKERDKLDIINGLVGDFVDSEAGAFMLKSMVDVEDGNQVYKDFSGNIVADNLDDFKKWMNTNPHMAHFVRGTKATGGGASGGTGKASGEKTMTRAEFDNPNFTPGQRMEFIKKGGKVI